MPRNAPSEPHPPRARLFALPGHGLPEEELARPLLRAGFACEAGDFEELDLRSPDGSALLLWVGEDWDRGFTTISEWPEAICATVVLVGKRKSKGKGLIRRMARAGGLAAVAFPMPIWFPRALAEALTRLENPSRRRLAEELEKLQAAQNELCPPGELLVLVAQAAKRLLGADLAVPALKQAGGARAIVPSEDGSVTYELWQNSAERQRAPAGLSTLVRGRQETRIVPKVHAGKGLRRALGPGALEAAILLPFLVPGASLPSPAPTLFMSLNLYWDRPFFPTVTELATLEVLRAIARQAVTLLSDQAHRSNLQAATHKIFSDAIRIEPTFSDFDSKATWGERAEQLAAAYATWPGLKALWLRWPQRGATAESWFAATEGLSNVPFAVEPPPSENPVILSHPAGWAVRAFAKEGEARYGEVVALFDHRAAAAQASNEVLNLATGLYLTFRLRQRVEDTSSLFRLTVPSHTEEAQSDILAILQLVKDRLASNGAKAFVMARDAEGAKIWQIASTDFSSAAPKPLQFLADRGFSDWVIRKGTWLLVPQLSRKLGESPEACWSADGEVFVFPRSEKEYWPEHHAPDIEDTMLFVPLMSEGQTIGALAVWRETPDPYDKDFDPGSLLYFAPHVATACRRMLQLIKGQEELTAIESLTQSLSQSQSIPEAWAVVTEGVRALASSRLAVLLRLDQGCGDYFIAAFADGAAHRPLSVADGLVRFRCAVEAGSDPAIRVRSALEKCLLGLSCRTVLVPEGSRALPQLLVAIFDVQRTTSEPLLLPDALLDHFARSYLQTASGLLGRYPLHLASQLIDDIGILKSAEITAAEVLDQAAEKLYQATGAEAVILYKGTEELMTVRSSRPKTVAIAELEVRPQSMTKRAVVEGHSKRVLEVEVHGGELDRVNLEKIEKSFGWTLTGSWLACPIVHRERTLGLIKLLTSNRGPFLGPDQEQLTQVVAQRTAVEMYKASGREHWRDLLQFIGEMSGLYGQLFQDTLVLKLTEWLRKALQRPRCELALVSRIGPESVPSLHLASSGAERWLTQFVDLSQLADVKTTPKEIQVPTRGVITPLILPVEGRITGHIFVLDSNRFYADDLETIEKATQHIAFLIDNEILREEWRQTMGRFRHTVLGPVQGLTSAARQLDREALSAGVAVEKLEKARLQILKESELIRLWRENHRFYLSSNIQILRRREAVRPIFERCLERYRPLAKQRGITLTLDFRPRALSANIDAAALDIALSNLLDNACKYAFYNRSINFGALVDDRTVRVWVEDIGNRLPEDVGDQIYRFGKRGTIRDPLRAITGQGIGLSLVLLIAAKHDGVLTHTSTRMIPAALGAEEDAKTPYRVRFTMDFPWYIS